MALGLPSPSRRGPGTGMRLLEFWQLEKGILPPIQMLHGPQSGQSEPQHTIVLAFQGAAAGMEREGKSR